MSADLGALSAVAGSGVGGGDLLMVAVTCTVLAGDRDGGWGMKWAGMKWAKNAVGGNKEAVQP